MNIERRELDLRNQTYAWLWERFQLDTPVVEEYREREAARREEAPAAIELVDQLVAGGDVSDFRESLDKLTSQKSSNLSLSGPNGQMVVNQMVNVAPDLSRAGAILGQALSVPASDAEAHDKISMLADYFAEIRKGNMLHAGRVAPLASVFWMLQAPQTWPARWASAGTAFEQLGWSLPDDPADGYAEYADMIRELGEPADVLAALNWYSRAWPGADPTVEQRVRWAWEMKEAGTDTSAVAFANVAAMLGPLRQAGSDLVEAIGSILGRPVTRRLPPPGRIKDTARYDAYVAWNPAVDDTGWHSVPALRLIFGHEGVLMGLHPGYRQRGWVKLAGDHLESSVGPALEIIEYGRILPADARPKEQSDFIAGRFISYGDFDWDATTEVLLAVAAAVRPVLDRVLTEGPTWGVRDPFIGEGGDGDLIADFAEFVAETGYPGQSDRDQQAAREPLAALLSHASLPSMDVATFRHIINTPKYGFAGNHAVLNTLLRGGDEDEIQAQIVDVVVDLLYGADDVSARLDRATANLKGLGQAGAMKLLAIVYPERFLPVFPLTGAHGKLALLSTVGIADLPVGTLGERSVLANDQLRERLGSVPELTDDPWGQMCFSYWLRDRATEDPEDDTSSLDARLTAATDACTLPPDSTFLADLVELLDDKGQIVLYGPPGTGKTYLALELAKALAPDEDRRALVQFHPSMAYEDFMEGFRPTLEDGQLTYQLTEGPLIELADKAALDSRPHVLIIDEMNRANLPKVFGELLFLLEYRGHPVKLAYRTSDATFSLPENLKIIGTMNLADRSVGQIDAALRRRFAFVPFTPNDEQNGGLLRRWLSKTTQPTWPADIVDEVNSELESALGHTDLLIGPSYFMKPDLDETQMARIWRYAIEPLMSDIFHGDEQLVKKFSWSSVAKDYAALMPSGDGGAGEGGTVGESASDD